MTAEWLTAALLTTAMLLVGVMLLRADPQPQYGTALDTPKALPALALTDDAGRPALLNDSHGKMRLIFYGFVRCPDVCPTTLGMLARVLEDLPPQVRDKIEVQLVSVDPEFDRPQVLRDYLNRFDSSFVGLTGDIGTVDKAAQEMFVGISRPEPPMNHMDHSEHIGHAGAEASAAASTGSEHQTAQGDIVQGHAEAGHTESGQGVAQAALLHGDQVSVVDAAGNFVRVYSNSDVAASHLAADLPALAAEYGPK